MVPANQNNTRPSGVRRLSLRRQLCLFFAIAAAVVTYGSGQIYSAREQALHAAREQTRDDAVFQILSLKTLEALRDERSAYLQQALDRIGNADSGIVRLLVMGRDAGFLASWHSLHSPDRRSTTLSVRKVVIGDETVGRVVIERENAEAFARIAETRDTIQWTVGVALLVLSVLTIAFVEAVIVRPADAMSRQLKRILKDPTVKLELQAGLVSREIGKLEEVAEFLQKALLKGQEDERRLRIATDQAVMASRAKSEFLANMSHELRTPLNSIIGFSEMIMHERLGELGNTKYAEYAEDIHGSGSHLLQIINDILDLSKVEAGKLELREERVDVDHMTTACLSIVRERAQEKNIAVETRIDPDLPPLLVDELRVRQALINLVGNAIKFTPDGGSVIVEAAQSIEKQPYLRVIDNGIGIAPDDIEKAMEPFGQADSSLNRRYDGSGLGLPLTKALVELHKGRFDIDSAEGVGTTVTLTFPQACCQPIPARGTGQGVVLAAAE